MFSAMLSDCRRTQKVRKVPLGSAKLMLLRSASAVCSFAYFCRCNGKCGARSCSCRHSCAWACKGSASGACAPLRRSRLLLQYLRFVTAGSCEHLASCQGVIMPGAGRRVHLGCLGMPDRRLMYGTEVQPQQPRIQALGRDLLFWGSGVMDVIGRAATLYRKRGLKRCFFISQRRITSERVTK